jgi:hypothetical protein
MLVMIDLEINVETTMYILLFLHQIVGQNRVIEIATYLLKMCHSSYILERQ